MNYFGIRSKQIDRKNENYTHDTYIRYMYICMIKMYHKKCSIKLFDIQTINEKDKNLTDVFN